ncbi:MAG: hypothetical protein DRP64_02650 [Verrucomicrobia bacterium]|nr:MAG: hypothetical protein DRP64_02650 [Verrucomicrobiota bacterium]
MKQRIKKNRKIVKGMPSAVVLSILIHAALFLLAGMLVVFTVVKKEEKKFVPPQAVERPKMKLRKPKVKVKKSAKPKPTTRIVTKVARANMPDIQLPEMSGMTGGLVGGLGGFDMMPDFLDENLFGGVQSIGNDFVGTFYDLKRDRGGKTILMDPGKYIQEMTKFVRGGWNTSRLVRYYQSPKKLYATTFAIPPVQSTVAPLAFGEPEVDGYCFAVHYRGQLVYKDDITFRFWGLGDDILVVRVDGKIVLNAPYPREGRENNTRIIGDPWQTSSAKSHTYWLGDHLSIVGDWITLKAGEPLDMEVLIGEVPGGLFQALLTVEVEGEEYPLNPARGGPTLPIFKTAPLSLDMVETIHAELDPGDACITNGPVFSDYDQLAGVAERIVPPVTNLVERAPSMGEAIRTWTLQDGRTQKGRFMTVVGDKMVLETTKGRQRKIPIAQLSPEDRLYVELANPPDFLINFSKKGAYVAPPPISPYESRMRPLQITDFTFSAKVKQSSTRVYSHELQVEFFAFGEEVDGDNYVLLDRQKASFIPSAENEGTLLIRSLEPIRTQITAVRDASPMRGTKYGGWIIVITDQRGKIIQYKTTHKWLFKCLENLKKLPVGKHFDKKGNRVGPPRPTPDDRPYWV